MILTVMLSAQELPSREAVREVIAVADAFWAAHPDDYIAIHCAYGAQRSLLDASGYKPTSSVLCEYAHHLQPFETAPSQPAARRASPRWQGSRQPGATPPAED